MPTPDTASRPAIPIKHSSLARRTRYPTSQPARPDVAAHAAADPPTVRQPTAILTRAEETDSTESPNHLREPRSHSRFASFGRIKAKTGLLQRAFGDNPESIAFPDDRRASDLAQLPVQDIPLLSASDSPLSDPLTDSSSASDTTLQEKDNTSLYSEGDLDSPEDSKAADAWLTSGSVPSDGKPQDPRVEFDRQRYTAAPTPRSPKMHQTSSRLLRMTEDDRPFTRVSQLCPCACVVIVQRRQWVVHACMPSIEHLVRCIRHYVQLPTNPIYCKQSHFKANAPSKPS